MLQKEFGLNNLLRGHTNVICCEMQFQAVAGTRAVSCHHSSVVAAEIKRRVMTPKFQAVF